MANPLGGSWDLELDQAKGAGIYFFFFFLIILPHYILIIHPFASKSQVFFAKKIKKFFYHMQVPFVKSKIKKNKKKTRLLPCHSYYATSSAVLYLPSQPLTSKPTPLVFLVGATTSNPFYIVKNKNLYYRSSAKPILLLLFSFSFVSFSFYFISCSNFWSIFL